MDQEVGGSSPPSCTNKTGHFLHPRRRVWILCKALCKVSLGPPGQGRATWPAPPCGALHAAVPLAMVGLSHVAGPNPRGASSELCPSPGRSKKTSRGANGRRGRPSPIRCPSRVARRNIAPGGPCFDSVVLGANRGRSDHPSRPGDPNVSAAALSACPPTRMTLMLFGCIDPALPCCSTSTRAPSGAGGRTARCLRSPRSAGFPTDRGAGSRGHRAQ